MTNSIAARIAARLAELEALTLPSTATADQRAAFSAQVDRLSVIIGGLRSLATVQAAEAAAPAGPDTLSVLVHIKASSPDATPAEMAAQHADIMAAAALLAGQPAPVDVPGLLPDPMPPMEASPPDVLPAVFAPWYLANLTPEFNRHGWAATIAGAIEHWTKFGRAQGRKWRPDAPPPAWGPREEDAPPGTRL